MCKHLLLCKLTCGAAAVLLSSGASQSNWLKLRSGVRVDAVDGPAARAGLREGDVVLTLDNTEITDSKQFLAVAAKVEKARAVSVMVRRGEWVNYLVIRPGR